MNSMTWNMERIFQCFDKDEAERISAIPLSPRCPEDKIIWGEDKKGNFTVKSAYHLAVRLFDREHYNFASTSRHENGWKNLWHTAIVPRIKHFLWRACVNGLPTKEILYMRKITKDAACHFCGLQGESIDHLFLRCPTVISVWKYGPLRINLSYFAGFTVKQFIFTLLENMPKEMFALVASIAWSVRKGRNKFYMEEQQFNWKEVLSVAIKCWREMVDTMKKTDGEVDKVNKLHAWKPPPPGTIMMDTDVAVLANERIGLGIIFRNEHGMVVFACRTEVVASGPTSLLEGLAIRYGLYMALLQKISKIHVQSDNQSLVRGLRGEIQLDPYSEVVKEDILEVATRVQVLSFTFIPRNCNKIAHLLARGSSFVGVSNIPPEIVSIVLNDTR